MISSDRNSIGLRRNPDAITYAWQGLRGRLALMSIPTALRALSAVFAVIRPNARHRLSRKRIHQASFPQLIPSHPGVLVVAFAVPFALSQFESVTR